MARRLDIDPNLVTTNAEAGLPTAVQQLERLCGRMLQEFPDQQRARFFKEKECRDPFYASFRTTPYRYMVRLAIDGWKSTLLTSLTREGRKFDQTAHISEIMISMYGHIERITEAFEENELRTCHIFGPNGRPLIKGSNWENHSKEETARRFALATVDFERWWPLGAVPPTQLMFLIKDRQVEIIEDDNLILQTRMIIPGLTEDDNGTNDVAVMHEVAPESKRTNSVKAIPVSPLRSPPSPYTPPRITSCFLCKRHSRTTSPPRPSRPSLYI